MTTSPRRSSSPSGLHTGLALALVAVATGGCIELQLDFDTELQEEDDPTEELDLREGTLHLPTGESATVRYEVRDGQAFWSDDVLLGDVEQLESGFRAATMASSLWPNATVVYRIDPSLTDEHLEGMFASMDDWTAVTGISFQEAPAGATGGFVRIKADEPGCFATLGHRSWSETVLNIGPGCESPRIWRHELGHTLGLMHEQARSDRDEFVVIDWDNIEPHYHYAFDKYEARSIPGVDRGPYDHASIMHYGSYNFTIDPDRPTLVTIDGDTIVHTPDKSISEGDASAVIAMYELTPPVQPGTAEVGSGSCVDACGGITPVVDDAGGFCYCDEACEELEDCCADVEIACTEEPPSDEPSEDPSSCQGRCGDPLPLEDCYCDDLCETYGDCCGDYVAECVAVDSCAGHCGSDEPVGECWCDDLCVTYGDCCSDHAQQCG